MKIPIRSMLRGGLYVLLIGLALYSVSIQAIALTTNTLSAAPVLKAMAIYFQGMTQHLYGITSGNIHMLVYMGMVLLVALLEWQKRYPVRLHYVLMLLTIIGALMATPTNPSGSVDLYYYIAYGRKMMLGLDPYTPLFDALQDPVVRLVPEAWYQNPSLYGPVAVIIFTVLNSISTPDMESLLLTFKLGWFGCFVVLALISHSIFTKNGSYPGTKWILFFANPMTWLLCLRDGHVEILILMFIALSLWSMQRQLWGCAGAAIGMFCSVKIVMLTVVPFFLWHALRRREGEENWKPGLERVLWMIKMFLLITLPLYVYFRGADILPVLEFSQARLGSGSISLQVLHKILSFNPFAMTAQQALIYLRPLSAVFVFSGLCLLIVYFIFARTPQDVSLAAGLAMLWLLLSFSYKFEWYILWSVFFLINGLARVPALLFVGALYSLYTYSHYFSDNMMSAIIAIFGFYGFWSVLNRSSDPRRQVAPFHSCQR